MGFTPADSEIGVDDWKFFHAYFCRTDANDREYTATVAEECWIRHLQGHHVPNLAHIVAVQMTAQYWGKSPEPLHVRLDGLARTVELPRACDAELFASYPPLRSGDWDKLDAMMGLTPEDP